MAEQKLEVEMSLRTIVSVRPGDTLVVAVDRGLSMERVRMMKTRLENELPGVKAVFVEGNGLAVYQPNSETEVI